MFSLSLSEPGLSNKEGDDLSELNLAQFSRYCNDKFHLRTKAQRLKEFRKDPQIPMATVFLLMVGSLAVGKRSFHQIDLFARQRDVRGWLGSDRVMVASDCTLWRVLPRMDRGQLREELQQAHALLRQQGQANLELPGGRTIRAVAVDGTVLAGRYASVLEPVGTGGAALDLEPCQGKGCVG